MTTQAAQQPMTLPRRYYTDPEIFRDELERFFFQTWVCAGRASQIPKPGDYFLRQIGGESVIIARGADNQIRAFYNVCRHRGTRMCETAEGSFPGRIQCPYHGWTYALDGSLMGAPHMQDKDIPFSREEYPLHKVSADVWDGHIFLNLSPHTEPLFTQLGDLQHRFAAWRMQDLQVYKRSVYEVKANWKLIVLNYNECLHCPVLHPCLNRLTNYLGADNSEPQANYIGGSMGFRGDVETMSLDGKRRRDYLPGLNEEQRKQVYYYAIYPNLLLSLHPDYMMTHTLWPRAVDRTDIVCEFHFHPAEMAKPDFQADDAVEFWDITNKEDWHISELSQLGISSRVYQPGPYSTREALPHAFDEMILDRERRSRQR